MTRREIKARARQQLGGGIFKNDWLMGLLACFIMSAILAAANSIVPLASAIVLTGPLSYGISVLFLRQARLNCGINIDGVFEGFKADFGGTLLIGLMSGIFTFLWSLLFVIPGIIKTYAYSMAYFVKADHPEYGWNQCLKTSIALMKGNKWRLFVLDLSFIGWYLVGALCLGIGTLWVTPYHQAARAQFYCGLTRTQPAGCEEPRMQNKEPWEL